MDVKYRLYKTGREKNDFVQKKKNSKNYMCTII